MLENLSGMVTTLLVKSDLWIMRALETSTTAANLGDIKKAADPVEELVKSLTGPLIAIVTSLATIYCIFLGAKLAKAEEPQEREKAKGALKNAIIGYLLIFVLIMVLRQVTPVLKNWIGA